MFQTHNSQFLRQGAAAAAMALIVTMTGCVDVPEETLPGSGSSFAISLNLNLPDSMTGGRDTTALLAVSDVQVLATNNNDTLPCHHRGVDIQDPFANGYTMTRFMVGAAATWACVADRIITIVDLVPHDGVIYPTENDINSPNYKVDDPTHYSVSDDSDTQTTVRLYYGYDRSAPPTIASHPGFFVSWDQGVNGDLQGRLILDLMVIHPNRINSKDPIAMRMDFVQTAVAKQANMYLQFDGNNPYANGMQIEVVKDLLANEISQQVFTARGLMDMKAQFLPTGGIPELPSLQMFTVADTVGEGAAVAEFVDVSLPLPLNFNTGNHLGNYLFTKTDQYFFNPNQASSQPWDYIYKTVTASEYRGARTTPATGGTWIPFDPSQDMIIAALGLDAAYFTGSACSAIGDNCNDLLNGIFQDGFAGQEQNQGADPMDWRSDAIATPAYLPSVYPNGVSWDGAFDMVFMPL